MQIKQKQYTFFYLNRCCHKTYLRYSLDCPSLIMKKGTWKVVKARMTCRDRRFSMRKVEHGSLISVHETLMWGNVLHNQCWQTTMSILYSSLSNPSKFVLLMTQWSHTAWEICQVQMVKTVALTPLPSPTQASDTEPLRSLKVYWKNSKNMFMYENM